MEFKKYEYKTFELVSYYNQIGDEVLVVTDSLNSEPANHTFGWIDEMPGDEEVVSEDEVPDSVIEIFEENSNE
jgi:hypothetical protein